MSYCESGQYIETLSVRNLSNPLGECQCFTNVIINNDIR